ncbi:MAG: GntR family transcriptional regulator, partial [Victivallales bacterium]|nr:GntR family transcriptional regulator [Victivallales bacterium]
MGRLYLSTIMPRKTEAIYSVLKQELQGGAYRPGSCFASEPSLMRRFGVSRITINKITELLVSEGFLVRGRKGSGTHVANSLPFPAGHIALILPYQNPYYDFLGKEIQRAAMEHGYCVTILYPYFFGESRCLDMILRGRFIGLISCGIGMLPADFPFPVVYLDQGTPNDGVPRCSVTSDDYHAAQNIMDAV